MQPGYKHRYCLKKGCCLMCSRISVIRLHLKLHKGLAHANILDTFTVLELGFTGDEITTAPLYAFGSSTGEAEYTTLEEERGKNATRHSTLQYKQSINCRDVGTHRTITLGSMLRDRHSVVVLVGESQHVLFSVIFTLFFIVSCLE